MDLQPRIFSSLQLLRTPDGLAELDWEGGPGQRGESADLTPAAAEGRGTGRADEMTAEAMYLSKVRGQDGSLPI